MILELFSEEFQVKYIKMQHALSMQGHLDALREFLDELEWNSHTQTIFQTLLQCYKEQE